MISVVSLMVVDWTAVAAVASVVVAVIALVVSMHQARNQRNWAERQQDWAEQNARSQVRPFFWTKLQTYVDLKSIILKTWINSRAADGYFSFDWRQRSTTSLDMRPRGATLMVRLRPRSNLCTIVAFGSDTLGIGAIP